MTPQNFMAVLLGDEEKVGGKKVLKRSAPFVHGEFHPIFSFSTEVDKVFVYFTDHGAPGLIGFPSTIVGHLWQIVNVVSSDDSQKPVGHIERHAQEEHVQ